MPRRHKNGFDSGTGAQDRSDSTPFKDKRNVLPPAVSHFPVAADQPSLPAADRGHIQKQPQVRSQPESPRVGDALSVEDDQVGIVLQAGKRLQKDRSLPEAQQSGDIGEGGFFNGISFFNRFQPRIGQQHHGGKKEIAASPVGNIRAGNQSGGRPVRPAPKDQLPAEVPLNGDGFGVSDIPAVQIADPHDG